MERRKDSAPSEVDLEEAATNFFTNASAAAPLGAASSELSKRLALLTPPPGRLTAQRGAVRCGLALGREASITLAFLPVKKVLREVRCKEFTTSLLPLLGIFYNSDPDRSFKFGTNLKVQ